MRLAILALIILIGVASAQANNKPGSGIHDAKCQSAWAMVSPMALPFPKSHWLLTWPIFNDATIDADEFMAGCKGES